MKRSRNPFAFFYNLKIGVKILIGYVAALALASALGVLAIIQLNRVNTTVTYLTGHLSQERDLVERMTVQIYRIRLYANQYIAQEQDGAVLTSYNQVLGYAQNLLDEGDQTITESTRIAILSRTRDNFDQFAAAFAEIIQLLSACQELKTNILIPQYTTSMDQLALLRNNSFEALDFTSAHYASQARDTFSQMQGNVSQYLATGDEKYADQADQDYEVIRSTFHLLNSSVRDQTARALVNEIDTAATTYHTGYHTIRSLVAQQHQQIASRLDVYGPAVEQSATEIADSINREFATQSQSTYQIVSHTHLGVLVTIGMVDIVGLAFGMLLSRIITRPIQLVARAAQGIAGGALDQEVPVPSNDELGILVEAFNHMTAQVRETMMKLKQSNETLKAVIDVSPLAIMLVDMDHKVQLWNPAAEHIFGWSAEEIIGQGIPIVPPDRQDEFHALSQEIIETGRVTAQELVRQRKDGAFINVSLSSAALYDIQGKPRARMAIIDDITYRKQTEDRLRQSEAELRQAQRVAKIGSWRWDIAGNQLHWSDEMYHIFGIEKGNFSGSLETVIAQAIHPDDRAAVEQSNLSVIQEKKPIPLEYRVIWPDGAVRVVWAEAGELILDQKGQPSILTGIVQDITERKRAEEALRENELIFSSFLEHSPVYVFFKDKEIRSLRLSSNYEQMLGMPLSQALGKSMDELFPSELARNMVADDRKTLEKGEVVKVVEEMGGRTYETTKFPIFKDGEPNMLAGFTIDITERKQAEEEVQRLNTELERRVIERTEQLETANQELESFSYSVSHDLRAPLRAIDGFSRILQEDFEADLPPDAARLIQSLRVNAKHMGHLIDDLLRFSRLSRQALNMQQVDTATLVHQALQTLEPEREGRQVTIAIGELPACWGDPGLLSQVWINLLSNALKFTRRREVAQIEIGCQTGGQGEQVYFVRDDGVGFNMQYSGKLFGVFQRLHSAEEFEGTGVGLALVQRIIQRHGGRIWAEARPDAGATFSFTLV